MPQDWMTSAQLRQAAYDGNRPADAMFRKGFTVDKLEAITGDGRRIRFVISTGDVDRDNDTIEPAGWDLSNYKRNPVVLWAHSHRDLPLAKAVEVGVEDGKLVAIAEFHTHPMAETVYQLLKGGFLNATSVGFRALEWTINEERHGVDFKRQELLEFSVVPVPANQHALVAAELGGVDMEPMRKWLVDVIAAWPGELVLPGRARKNVTEIEAPVAPAEAARADDAGSPDAAKAMEALRGLEALLEALAGSVEALAGKVDALAAQVTAPAEAAPAATEPAAQAEAVAGEVVLELEDGAIELSDDESAGGFGADQLADLRVALAEVVPAAIGEMVRAATRRELDRIRGRVS